MNDMPIHANPATRRAFLKSSTTAAGAALVGQLALAPRVFAAGSDVLKVGLVGCGGRGSGAAVDALQADPNVKLTAMGDAFADKLEGSLGRLRESAVADKVAVDSDRKFVGFDAYKQVIDSGIDVVILATPPQFRPAQLAYAVEQGKHVFCEKPVAVDAPGVRSVFATCERARQKRLSLVSGLVWRYDVRMRAVLQQVADGKIGDIQAIQATYYTQTLKKFPRNPEWSDMEFQMRNWTHFTWLSGDFNVEQHVHSIDKVLWAMNDQAPVRCSGVGGRQARTGEESGNVYDHFSVVYEFANGVKAFCACRQIDGCDTDVTDHIIGTKGIANTQPAFNITSGDKVVWDDKPSGGKVKAGYQIEHDELFASIRNGTPINNGDYMTKSTMMAIMGRMSAYTGKALTWEQALASQEDMTPRVYTLGSLPKPEIAIPGVTRFV